MENNTNKFDSLEKEVLDFWDKSNTFEKSVSKENPNGNYTFYDGPPFGTGEPHYGHLLSSIAKDVVPRYWTMRGYRVERRWGWDCHGLPIENIIEKDLGINSKNQIEELGIEKFNRACYSKVLDYADIWDATIRRIGRWVDFKNSYKTMDLNYMESVWWGFKELWNKDLIYEGKKVLLYCPRCETPISNFEVAMDNSYREIEDDTIYVKFKIIDKDFYILAWTTTPWTLPANTALAVNENIDYVLVEKDGLKYVLARDRLASIIQDGNVIKEFKGSSLVGLKYKSLFSDDKFSVIPADFVNTEDGTGIVHIAPAYGEDDYIIGQKFNLPVVSILDDKGYFKDTGIYFEKANGEIIKKLDDLVFLKVRVKHSYPHCHRCDTKLFYQAVPAWFLNISKIRNQMLENNKNINWYPEHLKEGRFAKGIEQAPDWNISRNRYFATPIPIWKCDGCENIDVVGSISELKEKSGIEEIKDIHNHSIDGFSWKCEKCGGQMKRITEVFDCWVESGSMPFAQMHYPFENVQKFESNFPAQYISEYISQTRAWFYVMHVISTALFGKNSFENVVTTGVILNEKGEKMSKSKKNFPDPNKVIDNFGADALRAYLMGSSLMHAENLFFSEDEVKDVYRKNIVVLWNIYSFYEMYAKDISSQEVSQNILDKWIVARLNQLIKEVAFSMDHYDIPNSVRPITEFINDFSTWYLRRSRDRFRNNDEMALKTMKDVLIGLSKVMAPFMPFISEQIWQKVSGYNFQNQDKSVHLEKWPDSEDYDQDIIEQMKLARKIVEAGLSKRADAGIKIRQPLPYYSTDLVNTINSEYVDIIKEELNILELRFGDNELGVELSEELLKEGIKRELIRTINSIRKNMGLTINDMVVVSWETDDKLINNTIEEFKSDLSKSVLAKEIKRGVNNIAKEFTINNSIIQIEVNGK